MPIEKGRWLGIDRNERKCQLCTLNEVGDEFHYLLHCPHFVNERTRYLPFINRNTINILTFRNVMCENDSLKLNNLSRFVNIICKAFKNVMGEMIL